MARFPCTDRREQALQTLLHKIQNAPRHHMPVNDNAVTQACMDWIHSQPRPYPKGFSVLGNHHYCALTVFNEHGDAAIFNSNTGKIYLGPLHELLAELKRLLTSNFELQRVDIGTIQPSAADIVSPTPTTTHTLLKKQLRAYIDRITSHHKQDGSIDFEYGFSFFARSRGLSRDLNYRLACSLLDQLNDTTTLSTQIDKKAISTLRAELRDRAPGVFNGNNGFTDRGINSKELNTALANARRP